MLSAAQHHRGGGPILLSEVVATGGLLFVIVALARTGRLQHVAWAVGGDACPIYPGKRYEDWDLPDPAGQDIGTVRRIRDQIRGRVEALAAELFTGPGRDAP